MSPGRSWRGATPSPASTTSTTTTTSALKEARLAQLDRDAAAAGADWRFLRADLADREAVAAAFAAPLRPGDPPRRPGRGALQPGEPAGLRRARTSSASPTCSRPAGARRCAHLTFASTSSVYGGNTTMPFEEGQGVDHPLQFYAATKRANELMAHAYAHLFRLPCTGLALLHRLRALGAAGHGADDLRQRDPRGPADPALQRRPPQPRLHLRRRHRRRGDPRLRPRRRRRTRPGMPPPPTRPPPTRRSASTTSATARRSSSPTSSPRSRRRSGKPAIRELAPPQPGDVPDTFADTARLAAATGWRAATPVAEGVRRFADWYREWHGRDA